MILRTLAFAGLLASSAYAAAQDQDADAITGIWESKSGGYVQIYKAGDAYAGKIVGSKSGDARYDENNPDESKRERRLLGINILEGLKYEGDKAWGDGEIYDPNSGKTYSANAKLVGEDELEVRGYVGISMLGKSQTWTPVSPDAPNVAQDELVSGSGQTGGSTTPESAADSADTDM